MPVVIRRVTTAVEPNVELDVKIDRMAEVLSALKSLEDEKALLKQDLKPHFKLGQKITSASGVTLRMDGRSVLNQEKFLARVGATLFNKVSKRVAVAALIKAAVLKGKIQQTDVDACMEPSENWFKIV